MAKAKIVDVSPPPPPKLEKEVVLTLTVREANLLKLLTGSLGGSEWEHRPRGWREEQNGLVSAKSRTEIWEIYYALVNATGYQYG